MICISFPHDCEFFVLSIVLNASLYLKMHSLPLHIFQNPYQTIQLSALAFDPPFLLPIHFESSQRGGTHPQFHSNLCGGLIGLKYRLLGGSKEKSCSSPEGGAPRNFRKRGGRLKSLLKLKIGRSDHPGACGVCRLCKFSFRRVEGIQFCAIWF